MAKYIVICGGVISGCGKGVAAASIGLLMRLRGFKVEIVKMDPYLNVDAGILAPREHGECFLCDDGTECDLDLGHYQRIAGVDVCKDNIWTSGTLNRELIEEQEAGKYLGQTVQLIPHVTNKIIEKLEFLGRRSDIVICEIGGTVGDIEAGAFYHAITRLKTKYQQDCLVAMVAPILWYRIIQENKTKPLQRSVSDLRSFGTQPDILFCRVEHTVDQKTIKKISEFTYVPEEAIFQAPDVETVYQVPLEFYDRQVDDLIVDKLHLKRSGCRIKKYRDTVEKYIDMEMSSVSIGIFGKYDNCDEAYQSLKEALYHAGVANNVKVVVKWVNAEDLEKYSDMRGVRNYFDDIDGIIIPGGFDNRGVEGKIKAIRYVREKEIPFLGICLGLQCAVIEFARNICGLEDANSREFEEESTEIITFVEGQDTIEKMAGTMRLGAYDCELVPDSLAHKTYGKKIISERHRHRYEVNEKYVPVLEENGFVVSGRNPQSNLVEIMELRDHPYFIGTQAHPEFKSNLLEAAPLFRGLVATAKQNYKHV